MEFGEYLVSKKIDPEKFKTGDPDLFMVFEAQFLQMHPASFTAQKLFLINKIRRMYQWVEKPVEKTNEPEAPKPAPSGPPRPKMIPKFKR